MRLVFIVILSILASMDINSQGRTTDRQPYAAGRFYAGDSVTLRKELAKLFENCKKSPHLNKVRAIISPHAGYVFSGKIAASAFSSLDPNSTYSNIFIIGSSHIMAFDGASVYATGDYLTPLGRATVNSEIAANLKRGNSVFNFPETAHGQEHSIEVQLPFIQYYFKKQPKIVPVIIGSGSEKTIKKIAEALKPWFTDDNLFVISSDFSHYPDYSDAVASDKLTAAGFASQNPDAFLKTLDSNANRQIPGLVTSMCGWTSGLTLLYLMQGNPNFETKIIDYANSGDSQNGNKDEVVGYNAIAISEKNLEDNGKDFDANKISFTEKEKNQLFEIARNSIKTMLFEEKEYETDKKNFPAIFSVPMGAFVTLKIDGSLRGCIGRFISSAPLYEVVQASALSSAFEDPRFPPLTKDEFKKTEMEITVLGPLKKINSINELILGKHGIYIKKGMRSGTMLPQVAIENNWTVEQFLGYTSRDKAGIGWDGWKDAELFIYDGIVLEESKRK